MYQRWRCSTAGIKTKNQHPAKYLIVGYPLDAGLTGFGKKTVITLWSGFSFLIIPTTPNYVYRHSSPALSGLLVQVDMA